MLCVYLAIMLSACSFSRTQRRSSEAPPLDLAVAKFSISGMPARISYAVSISNNTSRSLRYWPRPDLAVAFLLRDVNRTNAFAIRELGGPVMASLTENWKPPIRQLFPHQHKLLSGSSPQSMELVTFRWIDDFNPEGPVHDRGVVSETPSRIPDGNYIVDVPIHHRRILPQTLSVPRPSNA